MNETKTNWDHVDPKDPKGYYAYFGVSCYTDMSEITKAYIKILTECVGNHFVINEATKAYNLLSNPEKRREYDTSYHGLNVGPPADKPDKSRGNGSISLPGGTPGFQSNHWMGSVGDLGGPGGNRNRPNQGGDSDGCAGCIVIFVIMLIICGVINLFKLISG